MLRIAVPNKGSLADSSIAILKESGYRQRTDSRDLVLIDPDNSEVNVPQKKINENIEYLMRAYEVDTVVYWLGIKPK